MARTEVQYPRKFREGKLIFACETATDLSYLFRWCCDPLSLSLGMLRERAFHEQVPNRVVQSGDELSFENITKCARERMNQMAKAHKQCLLK